MTSNPLGQQRYTVTAVLGGVGCISDAEKEALAEITHGEIIHEREVENLCLSWNVLADSMVEASGSACQTLTRAHAASGVYSPRTRLLEIREAG